jgi:hypothetical protein
MGLERSSMDGRPGHLDMTSFALPGVCLGGIGRFAAQERRELAAAPSPSLLSSCPSCAGIQGVSLSWGSGLGLRWPPRRTAAAVKLPPDLECCLDLGGAPGIHFHDLRHVGGTLAAATGTSLRELMARLGHSSARAALM